MWVFVFYFIFKTRINTSITELFVLQAVLLIKMADVNEVSTECK